MGRDADEAGQRQEVLIALDCGRRIQLSPLFIGFVIVAPNIFHSRYVAKALVRKMVADGVVSIGDDGPDVVLRLTDRGRLELNGGPNGGQAEGADGETVGPPPGDRDPADGHEV